MFKDKVKYYRKLRGISQEQLAEKLGYKSFTTIQKWEDGTSTPPIGTVSKIANFLGVSLEELTSDTAPDDEPTYYLDDDAKDLAEFMLENPEYKVLFDATRNVSREDIEFVKEMLDRMSGNDGD